MSDRCGRCHRGLKNQQSVRRGFGAFCWKKIQREFEKLDKEQPLSDHFATVTERFIQHARLDDKESAYFRNEAEKAIKQNDKGLAEVLAWEAVHLVISDKTQLNFWSSMIRDIRNMFELASALEEANKQEKYLNKVLRKKYESAQRIAIRQEIISAESKDKTNNG